MINNSFPAKVKITSGFFTFEGKSEQNYLIYKDGLKKAKGGKMEENYLFTSKIDERSRITIPKEILDKSKIKTNSTVIIECKDNNTICIQPK